MLDNPGAIPVPLTQPVEAPSNDPLGPDIVTASDQYAARFAGEVGAFFLQRQAAAVAALLDQAGTGPFSVLDLGGGHAQLTDLFLDRGHSVVIHGSSTACFDRIAVLEARYGGRLRRLLGSLQRIPAADGEFDVVCSVRLFAHVSSWRELVAEKCRLSRRFVICEFPVAQGVQRLAHPLHMIKVLLEPDTRPFTTAPLPAVAAEFERHGFRVMHVERQYVLPMALHRRLSSAAFTESIERFFATAGLTRRIGSPVVALAERIAS